MIEEWQRQLMRTSVGTASPNPNHTSPSTSDVPPSGRGRAPLRLATSWLGRLTAYIGAFAAAFFAFQRLPDPLKALPLWLQVALLAALPVLALVFQEIPAFVERRRRKRLTEITGIPHPGYFRLAPREDQTSFKRADGQHEEILQWLNERNRPVCYLTGLSGSGKSSLLTAWVLPKLEASGMVVIRLRGYQDPIAALERELQKPGIIWQKPPADGSVEALLERACRHVRPKPILIVLDQFEEFVILPDPDKQQRFRQFLSSLQEKPVGDVAFLLVFRNDYTGPIQQLGLPPIDQSSSWREVSPFTESAAREFLLGSGLRVGDELMQDVLLEAREMEHAKGFIRPITINLCGLVMGRFATGLPRSFRQGGLIRAFLREAISLPSVRDIAPVLLPHLMSDSVTKVPRTVASLAQETGYHPAEIRGCLCVLGQRDRAIVRALDAEQQTWEISHDFLVPLLDSIVSRWTASVWHRVRPWVPWAAAAAMAVIAIVVSEPTGRQFLVETIELPGQQWVFGGGSKLAVAFSAEKKSSVWNLDTPWSKRVELPFVVDGIVVSARDTFLAGTVAGNLYVWRADQQLSEQPVPVLTGFTTIADPMRSLSSWVGFSKNEEWVHAISEDGRMYVWHPQEPRLSPPVRLTKLEPTWVMEKEVRFSPSGKYLVVIRQDRTLHSPAKRTGSLFLYRVDRPEEGPVELEEKTIVDDAWACCTFSNDDRWMAHSGANRDAVYVADLSTFPHLKNQAELYVDFNPVMSPGRTLDQTYTYLLHFAPNTNWIVARKFFGPFFVWQAGLPQGPNPVAAIQASRSSGPVPFTSEVAFSPDGKWVAGVAEDRALYVWQVDKTPHARVEPTIPADENPRGRGILRISFSPSGNWIVAGDSYGRVFVWKTNGRPDLQHPAGLFGPTDSINFVWGADDRHLFLFAGRDVVWGEVGGKFEPLIRTDTRVLKIGTSNGGQELVVFSQKHLSLVRQRLKFVGIPLKMYRWPELDQTR